MQLCLAPARETLPYAGGGWSQSKSYSSSFDKTHPLGTRGLQSLVSQPWQHDESRFHVRLETPALRCRIQGWGSRALNLLHPDSTCDITLTPAALLSTSVKNDEVRRKTPPPPPKGC